MKAVVMAGGEGSRLRPLTIGRPKPMVPVVNKPVLGHILDLLKSHDFTDVIITVRYLASYIQDYYEDGASLGMNLTYAVEEIPLGTAGSVKNAAQYWDEACLVISGDALTDFDLTAIVEAHKAADALATLTLTRVPDPLEYGVIITDEDARVTRFLEKPGWDEVISDTVNTGIYVLEPDVLALIPDNVPYDFSQHLFPHMLAEQMPMHGFVAEGYWCDIGNIAEYQRANADLLYDRVKLPEPIGEHVGGGIWVGEDVEIAPSAQLFGPIYLGNGVKVKGDVIIYGPSVIRDYTVIDNYNRLERSVSWRNCYIGEASELRGALICRQCSVKSHAIAYEGVVVGDNCVIGEGSVLHANVKLWPHKEVEAGTNVKESIIWGNQGRRTLFNRFGVSGMLNVDLTPEYAAKMGAALGATLEKGSFVAINRDTHRGSRMIKRALVSGLPGTGVHVLDTATVAIPVLRHFVRSRADTAAGIHVRLSPFDQRVVDIRFIDSQGLNQSTSAERAIERNFFREDFRRAYLDEIGIIDYPPSPIGEYTKAFLQHVNVDPIRRAQFRLVVDYSHGLAADTLAHILNQLDVDVVPLNARMDESKLAMLQDEFRANLARAGKIVTALEADVGVQIDVGGEKLFIVDEHGTMLDDITAAALMVELVLAANPGQTVAAPVTMPNAFETIAQWHDGHLLRIRNSIHGLVDAAERADILLAVDGAGNFVFPKFQPAIDGMLATVCLLENLAHAQKSVSEVVAYLPSAHIAHTRVDCPWSAKGMVMRRLNVEHGGQRVEVLDGLKIFLTDYEWVHLMPHPERANFLVQAEADSPGRAEEIVDLYRQKINDFLDA